MAILDSVRRQFRRVVFLEKAPEPGVLTLTQRRVFTLPSKTGLSFIVVLVLCFLTSTNYNLNLGFGMTYLLGGVAIVNTFYTFRNLAYLQLSASNGSPIFAGDPAEFVFHIKNPDKQERYALHLSFRGTPMQEQVVDIDMQQEITVHLRKDSDRRGLLHCPRVQIQTWFPLGLLRAWSTWLPASFTLVYPHPEQNPPPLPIGGEADEQGISSQGQEEFSGVKIYQQGDPLKHLAWKHIARVDVEAGGNLVSKQFSGTKQGSVVIDFLALPQQLDLESKLSRMTAWVLLAEQQQLSYAFKLGQFHRPESRGEEHRNACLEALALYGLTNDLIPSDLEKVS